MSRHEPSRREFLKGAAMAAAGTLTVTGAKAQSAPAKSPEWVIACRDAHLSELGQPSVWAAAKAIGAGGLEVDLKADGTCSFLASEGQPHALTTPGAVSTLGKALKSEKIRITAFCMHNHFDERLDEEIAQIRKVLQASRELDVPAIRIDVVPRKLAGKEDEFLRFAIDVGKRLSDMAEGTKVRFGVENHGNTTNKPEFLRAMFAGVGSPRYGLTLDTANFYWFGHPLPKLYEIYDEFAAQACHTHCKSIRYPESERGKQRPMGWEYGKYNCPVYEGDIDFKRVADILRRKGYANDLCIENESLGKVPADKRLDVLKREIEFLRKIARG